jgi:hypothetical protein
MKIKKLFRAKSRWTKGTWSRDKKGVSAGIPGTDSSESKACCWCLMGALYKCYPPGWERDRAEKRLLYFIRKLFPRRAPLRLVEWQRKKMVPVKTTLAGFNDSPVTTFEEVKQVVQLADV